MNAARERPAELWALTVPIGLWAAHFGAGYAAAAVWCARVSDDGQLGVLLPAYLAGTAGVLLGLGESARRAWRRYGEVPPEVPDTDSDAARHRFLALSTLLLAALAALAVGLVAAAFVAVGECA